MTLYRINKYSPEIITIEVKRVTETSAFTASGRRFALQSAYDNWFTSPEAAINHRRGALVALIHSAEQRLKATNIDYEKFEKVFPMTPAKRDETLSEAEASN